MENPGTSSIIDRLGQWLRESVTVKLASIGLLVIILLIPLVWIFNLMEERQQRAGEVRAEVSAKWSGSQTLAGPVMVVPYLETETVFTAEGKTETRQVKREAFFLPEALNIRGKILPRHLHRGIFDAVVYQSHLTLDATFSEPRPEELKIRSDQMLWDDACLLVGISDLRGISQHEPKINTNNVNLTGEPAQNMPFIFNRKGTTGIRIPLHRSISRFPADATISLTLKGSEQLYFIPTAKTTTVHLEGKWADPGFDGAFLPDNRMLSDSSFSAGWKVLHFNRPIPGQWVNEKLDFSASAFGVNLLVPAHQYQNSIRTAKYGILIILFTFISLFFMEVMHNLRIHPFQYILIGAALVIYYTLLLSFSEHIGFHASYWISTTATCALITAYAATFLKNRKQTLGLAALLLVFYAFVFVVTLQQDYALLTGSIGLFVVLGALMYISRRINWYRS
ncbi:MAG: cell envelope integrity protein CreD [Cyclobacteriaceae bacterium]|nr:MAG: cell envelope integrity protein CreD [Cyclobacteriaceae bacterium]